MKKGFLLAASALMAAGAMNAKTADEVRIYLNAGHGSWGPNDRPCATIPYPNLPSTGMPDTCGFYESNTDLWKVLKLGSKLEQAGFKKENIMYSRVKNGPYPYVKGGEDAEKFNRSLSEICEEVEANNMDVFLSVHSNAASEGTTTNYPLYLYRGTDGDGNDAVAGSRDMGKTMWPLFYTNAIDPQSYYSPTQMNLRGDISFYGSSSTRTDPNNGKQFTGYLGVLKHGAMGFLSEGFFHTYQPARHRALNQDYCGQEGVRYSRGIIKHFGGKEETTGYIMGTVKDLHEKIVNDLFSYAPGTNDQWLPINGATVVLNKGGKKVAEYTVDKNYNGVFVFENLEPGNDYTLDITAEGYKPLFDEYKTPIKVVANETTYPMVYLEATNYEPPKIVYVNYPDPEQPDYIQGVPAAINFKQDAAVKYDGVTGNVARSLQVGDSTIVLTKDANKAPALFLVNNADKTVKNISLKGIPELDVANPGYLEKISDIALTADHKLIACNLSHNQFNSEQVETGYTQGVFRVYKWDAFDADPAEWFTTQSSGNYYRADVGQALTVSGPSDDCTVVATAINNYDNTSVPYIRLVAVNIVDNAVASTSFYNQSKNVDFNRANFGENIQMRVSPRDDKNLILDGDKVAPFEFTLPGTNNTNCPIVGRLADDVLGKAAMGASYFKYAKHALMVAPYADDATGVVKGVKLLDVTKGLDNAKVIATTNTDITDGAAVAASYAAANVDGEDITAYLAGANSVTKMTTADAEQAVARGEYAYDLNLKSADGVHTFTFKVTGDAPKATLILTDKNDATNNGETTFEIGAVKAGENTYTIKESDLAKGEYSWAVAIESAPVAMAKQIFASEALATTNVRGGVAFIRDTESPAFGKIVVSNGKSQGFDIYSPTLVKEGNYHAGIFTPGNASSTLRVAENGGKIYANDWSDGTSGIWVFDPANPTEKPSQLFEGTRESTGAFTVDGNIIGGGGTGCDFIGTGADRKMYAFAEDYPVGNKGNKLVRYDIGEKATIGFAPSKTYDNVSAKMINTNVEILALDNGMFVSQIRTKGNNSAGVPGFVYTDYEDNILFNSGSDMKELVGCGSGIAVNEEGNLFAVSEVDEGIRVCRLSWNNNVPSFETLYHIQGSGAAEILQLDFDKAGNLCAYTRNKGFKVFAVPNPDEESPMAVTNAKAAQVVIGTSGAEDVVANVAAALKVYPNPATDVVNVEAGEDITSIAVFNLAGAQLNAQVDINGNAATVNVSDLAAGSYIIKVNKQAAQLIKK